MIFNIKPRNKFGTSTHAFWENFLTEEDIKKILSLPEWKNLKKATVGSNKNNTINDQIRKTKINFISLREDTLEIYSKLSDVIAEVNNRFFHLDITGLYENIQIGLYTSKHKDHYDWHMDHTFEDYVNVPRKLSMALLLNDPSEFEGGELQLQCPLNKVLNLDLKKGRAWFFPSWMLHRVAPVTKGERKSLVIWAGGPAFK